MFLHKSSFALNQLDEIAVLLCHDLLIEGCLVLNSRLTSLNILVCVLDSIAGYPYTVEVQRYVLGRPKKHVFRSRMQNSIFDGLPHEGHYIRARKGFALVLLQAHVISV